jgi:hypothetical protein
MSQPPEPGPGPEKYPYPTFGAQPPAGGQLDGEPPYAQPPSGNRKVPLIIAGAVVLIVLVAVALVFALGGGTASKGPESAVVAQYEAYKAKDYGTVYDLTCKRIKQQVPRQLFIDSATKAGTQPVRDIKIRGVHDSAKGKDWKSVDVALTGGDGQTKNGTVEVVNEDGWKVCTA